MVVLGKLSAPGRPTYLDNSRARIYRTRSRCGWGCSPLSFLLFLPLIGRRPIYKLKYCLTGPLDHKQLTNQPTKVSTIVLLSFVKESLNTSHYKKRFNLHVL